MSKAQKIADMLHGDSPGRRRLIAVAGPPASGKSTVAAQMRDILQGQGVACGVLAMDGFHLDNDALQAQGLLARKGAPETFDLEGFRTTVDRLHREDEVPVPVFDRVQDKAIVDAEVIDARQRLVIVEGNYLLLDEPGWRALAPSWNMSVFLNVDMATLEQRLIDRWLEHGHSQDEAVRRAQDNDLPNARRVMEHRLPCDLEL